MTMTCWSRQNTNPESTNRTRVGTIEEERRNIRSDYLFSNNAESVQRDGENTMGKRGTCSLKTSDQLTPALDSWPVFLPVLTR